jgi:urease beta subunit
VQTSAIRRQRRLPTSTAARVAIATASRRTTTLAVLVAALLLLALALAPKAGASVYWTDGVGPVFGLPGTTISRANNDGTGVNPNFIGGASTPSAVAVDAAHIYWINEDFDHSIARANLDGTGVNQRFITGVNAGTLAVDGAHIYWSNVLSTDTIGRANLDGSGVNQAFITGAHLPSGIAADRAHVYWTNSDTHAIGRANLDGTGVNQSFIDVGLGRRPTGLAVDAAHLYWADIRATSIGRANIDGTGVNPDFVPAGDLPFGIAVDSAHIYWTNQFPSPDGLSGGTIGRANLDGTGVTQTFLSGFAVPLGVAVDVTTQAAPPSRASIGDVRMAEGNAGQSAFRFTVALDQAQSAPVTVEFATADGTASAPSDYTANSGTVTFAAGETAKTVTVEVNGDTTVEPNETFNVNLANATGNATIADGQAVGTIVNDDQPVITQPSRISIGDVSTAEGNAGQSAFRFTVALDQGQSAPVTVEFATADGTASAPSDYTANSGTVTFAAGETAKTVTVQVNGDTAVEPDETFNVNLANASGNATITDAAGVGTIVNDDQPVVVPPSRISIGDVSMAEGNAGQSAFRFTAALDAPQSAPVTVGFATANGTATAPSDYAAATGTVTFAPGETAKTVTVQVNGDTRVESNETFSLHLTNATGNATIADGQAVGTIVNDDRKGKPGKFALGRARLNPKTGTAELAVAVPGPGTLAISGPGVKAAGARVARPVRVAGTMRLLLRASGKNQTTLTRTGTVTVRPRVTYTPIGGRPNTRSTRIRLKKAGNTRG